MAFDVLDGNGAPLKKGSRVRGAGAAAEHDDLVVLAKGDGSAVDVEALLGPVDQAAPANDAAASGLNGLLRRLLGRFPALGPAVSAGSLSMVPSSDSVVPAIPAPVGTAAAFNAGIVVGGLFQFTGLPQSAEIVAAAAVLSSGGTYGGTLDLLLFNSNPNDAGTALNNAAAPVIAVADRNKIIGVVPLAEAASLSADGSVAILQARGAGLVYNLGAGNSTLWAVLVNRGATLTLTGATHVQPSLRVRR